VDLQTLPFEFNRSMVPSLLWLGNFAVFFSLHLALHPRASYFRKALRLAGRYPAPVLFYATSAMVATLAASLPWNVAEISSGHSTIHGWPLVWLDCLSTAITDFVLIFHSAIVVPKWSTDPLYLVTCQALISAFSQIWLCCYLLGMLSPDREVSAPFREALIRWKSACILAACHLPWWWWETQPAMPLNFPLKWLLLEFLLFLAPLPLAIAWSTKGFLQAGDTLLRWWRMAGVSLFGYALTALAILTLVQYTTRTAAEVVPADWLSARQVMGSLMTAVVHVWLFITSALLLLRSELSRPAVPLEPAKIESAVES